MAIDGSFTVSSALERFLERCPKLGTLPRFESLVNKGQMVTEEEVVKLVAEVFLHPKYTIPLIGSFRPIIEKIVDKAVALLRDVQNLGSNSDDIMEEYGEADFLNNSDSDEVIDVVMYHDQRGRGLDLHELASLAFCRALDLAPFLLGSIASYFNFSPPPFQRILITHLSSEAVSTLSLAMRISYRFLMMEPEFFSRLWDWSCFLDLVNQLVDIDSGTTNLEESVVKWCGIQVVSVILRIGNFGVWSEEEACKCLMSWEKFCQDVSLERLGYYLNSADNTTLDPVNNNIAFNENICLQSVGIRSPSSITCQESEPSTQRRRLVSRNDESYSYPFVLTSKIKKSFEMVLLAVSQKWPVLLYGPAGVGKSALIRKLAHDTGNQVLSIHMDDQLDGKTLVGSFVSTEMPGEFKWQPGSLTQAVLNGYWVVFEDIDKAPSDVQSILLPLLEGASSFLTSHGEEVPVAESFRLFSTISSSKLDVPRGREGRFSLGILWRRIMVGQPGYEDVCNIIKEWYPKLVPLAEKLIETFSKVNSACSSYQCGFLASHGSVDRFSIRDLLKWCKRIAILDFSMAGPRQSAYVCHRVYQDAVDILAASSTSKENRLSIMKEIAKIWGVPDSVADSLYPPDKPIIQDLRTQLRIGRVTLQKSDRKSHDRKRPLVDIRSSMHLLERISCSIEFNEPVLLVGETGTGKTTLVQTLASRLGRKLTVLNLSQQSDITDLLGGFRPMDAQYICNPLYNEFVDLLSRTFSAKANVRIFNCLHQHLENKNWKMLLAGLQKVVRDHKKLMGIGCSGRSQKQRKASDVQKEREWDKFSAKLDSARVQICGSSGMIFSFVEGAFLTALRNGEWVLLDEVNLAPPETLQRILGVLEGEYGSLCLAERGDVNDVHRHPNFRIFACMNPATDAGKRDLPYSLRSRFTEYFVDDVLDDEDLTLFVTQFIDERQSSDRELVKRIVSFYKAAKKDSDERLQDGANQKPQYSLRSLYRALEYKSEAERHFGFEKAIYDGFSMFFLTLLDGQSAKIMNQMILSRLLGGKIPAHVPFDEYLRKKVVVGVSEPETGSVKNYVLTKSVKEQLSNLARAILIKRYPVLLQGPTSSGKTSLVRYLAAITGHEFVRINNHEHTDLQEYLGSYITDSTGKLVFQEGVLVKAVKNGYWVVLDELNLAPSDVLEALNRLLDDNRELFVPELRETVKANPKFMLFATQNPPTFYGGRKMLSRAFRNRFVEIHVDEIPQGELSTILEKRCEIPASRAKKMVEVMRELQLLRQRSKVFAGKHGFITPRDLFRWANRSKFFGESNEDLAKDGYYLLAERLRDEDEKRVVEEVLKKHFQCQIRKEDLYKDLVGSDLPFNLGDSATISESLHSVICTKSMRRLYFLVRRCYEMKEPVLLVGETGGGKTTVCQILSKALRSHLHTLNCHQYTETADFIGGFYPIRQRSEIMSEYASEIKQLALSKIFIQFFGDITISPDISQAPLVLDQLARKIDCFADITQQDFDAFLQKKEKLARLYRKWQTIFSWQDGPLVDAMREGSLFLVDEISLADDSVLERLNSVLEPERKLSLAEKGESTLETITAEEKFLLLATMNPGGDYGKKELSPALRNRFTEIWVPSVSDLDELKDIALKRFSSSEVSYIVDVMLKFWEWFNELQIGRILTVRDLLSWVDFINATGETLGPEYSFLHGVFLVLLDGLTLGTAISRAEALDLRERCLFFILMELQVANPDLDYSKLSKLESYGWGDTRTTTNVLDSDKIQCSDVFGIDPFYIKKGDDSCEIGGFEFLAPTTRMNALRLLRAMQLSRPVLLEGSPGVGKTSLVMALGKYSGHRVVRINLSEQTDMMDLLGSDLPVESDEGLKFAWSDGILLQALKDGCWVLLDELNLAPQSVLEGLNAMLDHRAEVFIPELGRTFKCPPSFRVFACQNPSHQGGGRKGLPKSFLNRFTKVYVDELVEDDYLSICAKLHPSISEQMLSRLITFNKRLHEETMLYRKFAQDGSPWEFNLRDVIRSCEIIQGVPDNLKVDCFLDVLYIERMRTAADRKEVIRIYEEVFGVRPFINPYPRVHLNSQNLHVGISSIQRNNFHPSKLHGSQLKILPGIRQNLEAAVRCIQHRWLCILVGPPGSGKTSLVRLLSQLTGNVLHELNLSAATDISELIGCFEQYNILRNLRLVVSKVEHYISEYCGQQLASSKEVFIREKKELITKWLKLLSCMEWSFASDPRSAHLERCNTIFDSLGLLVEIVEQIKLDLERSMSSQSSKEPKSKKLWSGKELDRTVKMILNLQDDHKKRRPCSAKFEWVPGSLIKAIEYGEWIVLEDANLCNPTVLDRINSLVESYGSITINECGTLDGKPMVLHPHPNFRMFLTVDPSNGEISRAMRNRGVEIFMMPPDWLLDKEDGDYYKESELNDVKAFLIQSAITVPKLVDSMAKAHIYAKDEGPRIGVRITYLELSRWVQLFQQLLVKGNRPYWSLLTSWEHTYLSSLGEAEGADIIRKAILLYLPTELCEAYPSRSCSLRLPSMLSMPSSLRDFIWYSKETSVRQNFKYLEFIISQYAPYEQQIALNQCQRNQTSHDDVLIGPYSINAHMLQNISNSNETADTKFEVAKKMLLFAANWAIEQATLQDLDLYPLQFSWYRSQLYPDLDQQLLKSSKYRSKLDPFWLFLNSFINSFQQELEHPIWQNNIISYHKTVFSNVDLDRHPIPLLSLKSVDLLTSSVQPVLSYKAFCNAVNCIGPLRLTVQQWNTESWYTFSDEKKYFQFMLEALKVMEKQVLDMLVDSPSFDILVDLYSDLVEDHVRSWRNFTSAKVDLLRLSWRSLKKTAAKLVDYCPEAAKTFLLEVEMQEKGSPLCFCSDEPFLWIYGGHPVSPSSALLHDKQFQLLNLCELIWPTKPTSLEKATSHSIEIVASYKPALRSLAVEGICMSSHMVSECDEDDKETVQQLVEMHQTLSERFQLEKSELESYIGSTTRLAVPEAISATCCIFPAEVLGWLSGFNCWLESLPLGDSTSFFMDMQLLEKLSTKLLVGNRGLEPDTYSLSSSLESALKFSLTYSSRPTQAFSPHQKLIWVIDAWTSVGRVHAKYSSFVNEMWFRWHQALWSQPFGSSEEAIRLPIYGNRERSDDLASLVENLSKMSGHNFPPRVLMNPIKAATVVQILQSPKAVKDYSIHCLRLKVASSKLWQSPPIKLEVEKCLLSSARSLLQQIIYAHRKSFDNSSFESVKSFFCSLQGNAAMGEGVELQEDNIRQICSLILKSSHHGLRDSVNLYIEDILRDLYHPCASDGFYDYLGCAWWNIGKLRLYLLSRGELDPAVKYAYKYSQLAEKISLLELEMKVRHDCDHWAGSFGDKSTDVRKEKLLDKLKAELKKLQRKIVFRPDRKKEFKVLKGECDDFCDECSKFVLLSAVEGNVDAMNKARFWQDKAISFINRLSDEYSAYIDMIQPIQVAIYEMKLGLLLILSSAIEKKLFAGVGNMDKIMDAIYFFMRFPREYVWMADSIEINNMIERISLLKKLVTVSIDHNANPMVSSLKNKAALSLNILVRIAHSVADSQLMNFAYFTLLDKLFDEFASAWVESKERTKIKEENEAQMYKFKPRTVKIGSVFDDGFATLRKSLEKDSLLESQELLFEDEQAEMDSEKECEVIDEEWRSVEKAHLNNVVNIHDQLFGSNDFVQSPGTFQVSDGDRLLSFTDSYTYGTEMLRGFWGLRSSSLDSRLIPEHLLRLCLEHEQMTFGSNTSVRTYNFYQDSNSDAMAKMVELLARLQQKISPLAEGDDHPLKKIVDITEMLLKIPLSSPLAKAFSGLQLLLNRVHMLQRNSAKLSLSDQLEPIIALVTSWQKMELDSWPALFDEVQNQCNSNAGELWFPLYTVLLHKYSADDGGCNLQSIIQSLEEFIESSSVGEFGRRLQLLLAFLVHINTGVNLGAYSRQHQGKLRTVLYNMFGYYVQFLPLVSNYIEENKKDIDTEMKELQKLSRWERFDSYSSFENSRKNRQKVRKLIQKYTDIMGKPVNHVLHYEAVQQGVKVQSPLDPMIIHGNIQMLKELTDFKDRSEWCMGWWENATRPGGTLWLENGTLMEEIPCLRQCFSFQLPYEETWKEMWGTLEIISAHCDVLSRDENQGSLDKGMKEVKKRALSELLNYLKACGLSRNRFEGIPESNQSSWWLLDSSHDVDHLLLTKNRLSPEANIVSASSKLQSLDNEWKTANEYYFKSMASVQLLREISLKFKKDFSSAQVKSSVSFLSDLIYVQQEQRSTIYKLSENLKQLQRCVATLENMYSCFDASGDKASVECCIIQNQSALLKCLWNQKQIFDSLSVMLHEQSLLLKAVDGAHSNTCQSVKAEANVILAFISKFVLILRRSKESLDNYLLGDSGIITTTAGTLDNHVVSKKMERSLSLNFQILRDFEKHLIDLRTKCLDRNSTAGTLLGHFDPAFKKIKLLEKEFHSILEGGTRCTNSCEETNCGNEVLFDACYGHIKNALKNLGSSNHGSVSSEESLPKITSWKSTFKSYEESLGIQKLCSLLNSIFDMQKLVNNSGENICLPFHMRKHYSQLRTSLRLILDFANCLLQDFLALHKSMAVMTHVLANVLASLYYRGFGREEEQVSDDGSNVPQDASGTGMGEGAGLNDISSEINDEDQLLGASEKPGDDENNMNENPSKKEKGIEMEQDFNGDAFSVSEESGEEDDNDTESEHLDNAMGDAGPDSEAVDEKIWNKDEDENPNSESEKNELGPSVKDRDPRSRELRAKEESASDANDREELGSGEPDNKDDEAESQDDVGDDGNVEDMNIDKEEAFTDPTGLKVDELNQNLEQDMEIDEEENGACTEDGGSEELESTENAEHEKENDDIADGEQNDDKSNGHETSGITETEEVDGSSERENPDTDAEGNADRSSPTEKNDSLDAETSNLNYSASSAECKREQRTGAQFGPEVIWSNGSASGSGLAPSEGLPSDNFFETELAITNSKEMAPFTDKQSKMEMPNHESSAPQRTQPNPFRNVVDAVEEWKERAKVSTDLHANDMEMHDMDEDENADEYGYISESEKGTAQAMGPATVEQTERSRESYKPDGDSLPTGKDEPARMDIDGQTSEAPPVGSSNSFLKNKVEEGMQSLGVEKLLDEGMPEVGVQNDGEPENLLESIVSVRNSYLSEDIRQFKELSVSDEKTRQTIDREETFSDSKKDATAVWRKYELLTTRLSQELAEQLRLVLEPTLASKLQGDYKTGKRINMKKVIPYIASHYRKDKIWLRRTRPNKRDYQVVIAVDDSRSMSESGCGDVAIEALVTVCRAMSQLEMGNLAVTSFGKEGNVRLLHDFEQPFSGEAGVKMISSLSFKQENSIADEPVVDLLKYLKNMMDAAVARSRLSSGHNPLEQLVLIIADGRFHEKDNLKRYVRDFLNKKRMVAFVLLDNPQESIVDLKEASFEAGSIKFSNYLDSFPFPYYIVLRNIEALPRTLADLLRQWFELMQYSRE